MQIPESDNANTTRENIGEYVGRLGAHLDAPTLEATLGLMISEYRAAIRKQRGLIGLERLGRHDTSTHMNRLDQLEAVASSLTVARQHLRVRRGLDRTDQAMPFGNVIIRLRRILL